MVRISCGGVFHVKGWAPKSSVCPSKPRNQTFGRDIAGFCQDISTSDFQSEVGVVFGEIGGELPAKFGRRFSSFFCWGPPKLHRKLHHQTSLRGSGFWRALRISRGCPKNLRKKVRVQFLAPIQRGSKKGS